MSNSFNDNSNGRVRDVRIQHLEEKLDEQSKIINKQNDAIDDLKDIIAIQKTEIAKLGERVSLYQLGQGSFTLIIGAIATFIAWMVSQ